MLPRQEYFEEVLMKLAMIGLGKMGLNMATRLVRGGHRVIGFDLNPSAFAIPTAVKVSSVAIITSFIVFMALFLIK